MNMFLDKEKSYNDVWLHLNSVNSKINDEIQRLRDENILDGSVYTLNPLPHSLSILYFEFHQLYIQMQMFKAAYESSKEDREYNDFISSYHLLEESFLNIPQDKVFTVKMSTKMVSKIHELGPKIGHRGASQYIKDLLLTDWVNNKRISNEDLSDD